MNTSKYAFLNNRIISLASLKPIPADEPVFILRAQDVSAQRTLQTYRAFCETDAQRASIDELMLRMRDWQLANHEVVKSADNHERGSKITSINIKNLNESSDMDVPVVASVGRQFFSLWEAGYIFAFQDFMGDVDLVVYPPSGLTASIKESCRNAPEAIAALVDKMIRQFASALEANAVPAEVQTR